MSLVGPEILKDMEYSLSDRVIEKVFEMLKNHLWVSVLIKWLRSIS